MIEPRFCGMALADIPPAYFKEPFETWAGQCPALVLAATRAVPVSISNSWRLAFTFCGGHREDIFYAAVLPLEIHQDMMSVARMIADAGFTEEYLGYFESLPGPDRQQILASYGRFLGAAGLTCSAQNLQLFSEDLYPVDATPANLRKLCAAGHESDCDSDNLVLFITGPSD